MLFVNTTNPQMPLGHTYGPEVFYNTRTKHGPRAQVVTQVTWTNIRPKKARAGEHPDVYRGASGYTEPQTPPPGDGDWWVTVTGGTAIAPHCTAIAPSHCTAIAPPPHTVTACCKLPAAAAPATSTVGTSSRTPGPLVLPLTYISRQSTVSVMQDHEPHHVLCPEHVCFVMKINVFNVLTGCLAGLYFQEQHPVAQHLRFKPAC